MQKLPMKVIFLLLDDMYLNVSHDLQIIAQNSQIPLQAVLSKLYVRPNWSCAIKRVCRPVNASNKMGKADNVVAHSQ